MVKPMEVVGLLVTATGGVARVPWPDGHEGGGQLVVQYPDVRVIYERTGSAAECQEVARDVTVYATGVLVTETGEVWPYADLEVCGATTRTDLDGKFAVDAPPGSCDISVRWCDEGTPRATVVVPGHGEIGAITLQKAVCGAQTPPTQSECERVRAKAREVDWTGEAGDREHQHIFDELAAELLEIRDCAE